MYNEKRVKKLVLSAVLLATALVLPILTGQIPTIGKMLCPMHFPVIICGYICGPFWGIIVGFVAPIVRFLIFSQPVFFPTGLIMAFELAAYGFFSGLFDKIFPKKIYFTYISLILSMIAGRIIKGIVSVFVYGLSDTEYGFAAFFSSAVTNALPSIILQIIIIPTLIITLRNNKGYSKNMNIKDFKIKNFIFIFIAGIINAIGVTLFLFPVKLYDSGVSGLSMLLDQVTPEYLTLSLFLIVINIPIFILGYKKEGLIFTVYSLFSVIVYSVMSFLIMDVLPIDIDFASPLAGSDLLLCAIFGGVISGIGSGIVIRYGGAIDGIDVISVLFAKKIGISIGTFNLIFNILLYTVCGLIIQSWILPLYSMVTYFAGSKTIDFIVDGLDSSKCAMIITTEPNSITERLSKEFTSTGTFVDAVGGYSKDKKSILYFVVNHFQINKLKNIVHEIDPNAYIMTVDVSDIITKETKGK